MTDRVARRTLWAAGAGVLLTGADTYVVVVALPDIMEGVGLTSADLPRAAPIVSMFLLGYIAVLPLLGRVSDRRGRVPVLLGCLLAFSAGSAMTAVAGDLPGVVAGRFLQGLGAGGLVPVTLALVADTWTPDRRGVPLGAVGGVQELGSVVGPLYGAGLLVAGSWRLIFAVNLLIGLGLLGWLRHVSARAPRVVPAGSRGPAPALWIAAGLMCALSLAPPSRLSTDVRLGALVEPLGGSPGIGVPTSPLALLGVALAVAAWVAGRRHRTASGSAAPAPVDRVGAVLLSTSLGAVVLALASADPESQVLAPAGVPLLGLAVAAAVALALWERRHPDPLLPPPLLRARGVRGSLLVSLLLGAALVAVLVDVPLYARATPEPRSQVGASLVLLRFLVGLPIGAVLGGLLLRRTGPRWLAVMGCLTAAVALADIAGWDVSSLSTSPGRADLALLVSGLGLGLAIAPVNDAALRGAPSGSHGLVSSLVVVARSAGMLLGLSILTAVGLSRFRAATAALPSPSVLCPGSPLSCPAHLDGIAGAVRTQALATLAGAAVCAALAAVVALTLPAGRQRSGDAAAEVVLDGVRDTGERQPHPEPGPAEG